MGSLGPTFETLVKNVVFNSSFKYGRTIDLMSRNVLILILIEMLPKCHQYLQNRFRDEYMSDWRKKYIDMSAIEIFMD